MSSHTPGPWTLTHIQGSNFAVQEFKIRGMFGNTPNVYPIFNRDSSAIDGATVHCSPEDARLIAAAPELLEALIDLGDWLAYGLNKAAGAEPTAEDHAACERVAAKARAAVAKATGR